MKKILLTGSSGFIGQRFVEMNSNRYEIRTVSLRNKKPQEVDLQDVDVIVHLAGLAHQLKEKKPTKYNQVNYQLTKELCDHAITHGVEHFVYASTLKVFGDAKNRVLSETSACNPQNDPYGESKLMAEKYLETKTDSIKIAVVRPPLVYGPRVKANMLKLIDLCKKDMVLPFGKIYNRRTMVFVDNLVDIFNVIIDNKSEGLFLAGDGKALSTTDLIVSIKKHLGLKPKLVKMPGIARTLIKVIKPGLQDRLFQSLEMDVSDTFKRLNYTPKYSSHEGIGKMVEWYLENKQA